MRQHVIRVRVLLGGRLLRCWSYMIGGGGGWGIFFFNDTATTEIYTLSLHDALLIFQRLAKCQPVKIPILFRQLRHIRRRRRNPITKQLEIGRAHV